MMQTSNPNGKKYKIAIIAPVPFYYHTPLYRKLAASEEIDLTVYYCSDETLYGTDVKKTYNAKGKFVVKSDLLKGYSHKFLKNYSVSPSYLNWPFGLVNFGIWSEIKNGKYDLVVLQSWTNFTWWMAFTACLRFKVPVLFMTDSNILSESLKPGWKIKLKSMVLGNFLFKNSRGFLASGDLNEKFYEYYGVPKNKIVLFPFSWGYEDVIKKFEELKNNRVLERRRMGIEEKDVVMLYVGRLSSEKMPLIILDAYAKAKGKNKKLFIVGDGILRKEVEDKIKDLNLEGVSIVGFQPRDQVFKYYNIADLLILPSKFETWGIVVNEAMCFNLPIIASSMVGAAPDLIKDGNNGFMFRMGDENDLAQKIEEFMNLSSDKILLFRKISKDIIIDWINKIDPKEQILKFIKK